MVIFLSTTIWLAFAAHFVHCKTNQLNWRCFGIVMLLGFTHLRNVFPCLRSRYAYSQRTKTHYCCSVIEPVEYGWSGRHSYRSGHCLHRYTMIRVPETLGCNMAVMYLPLGLMMSVFAVKFNVARKFANDAALVWGISMYIPSLPYKALCSPRFSLSNNGNLIIRLSLSDIPTHYGEW